MGSEIKKYVGLNQLQQYDSLIKNYVKEKDKEHLKDYTYMDENGSTVELGGLPIGWKPDTSEMSVSDVLYAVLHPYTPPIINLSGSGETLHAIGTSFNGITLTCSVEKRSNPITLLTLLANDVIIFQSASYPNGGVLSHVYGAVISNNITFRLIVTDGISTVDDRFTYSFIPYVYSGITKESLITIDMGDILLMDKRLIKKENTTVFYSCSDSFCVFVYPVEYGGLYHIYDQNGFEVSTGFNFIELLINEISYYVYQTNNKASLDNFSYRFVY